MSNWADEIKRESDELMESLVVLHKAELAYMEAKSKYERNQRKLAETMRFNGLESLTIDGGYKLAVVEKVHCSINKSAADKERVAKWMEKLGFEAKVKRSATVAQSSIDDLRASGIPFEEVLDLNTNSVKAVIKELLAGGMITTADIPQGCNYYQEDIVEVHS